MHLIALTVLALVTGAAGYPTTIYLGYTAHRLQGSHYADLMAREGIDLQGQISTGVTLGILKDSGNGYHGYSTDLSYYQVKSDPSYANYQVISLKVGGSLLLARGFLFRFGFGPSVASEGRRWGFLKLSDSLLGWPWFGGFRYGWRFGFLEVRYSPLGVLYEEGRHQGEMEIGGLFGMVGLQYPLNRHSKREFPVNPDALHGKHRLYR